MTPSLNVGDAVTWRHTPRGGWGYDWRIPAVIVSKSATRVRIAVLRQGEMALAYRSVMPDRCEALQPQYEPMVMDIRRLLKRPSPSREGAA